MHFINNLSIKSKLLAVILSVSLFALVSGSTVIIISDIKTFRNDMASNMSINAKLIGEYCAVPLFFDVQENVMETLEKLKAIPNISAGIVYNSENEIFADFCANSQDNSNVVYLTNSENITWFENDFLHVVQRINFESEAIGSLYLKVSTKALKEKINKYLLTMLTIILAVLLVSYFLALIIQGFISKPIIKLTSITKMISKEADYTVRVEKPGNDEIGMLYDEYNYMLEQINIREEERDKAYEELKDSNIKVIVQNKQLQNQKSALDRNNKELNYINEQITASIEYAKRIQVAVLPEYEFISSVFPDSFVIYKPKDIVSGDFYWMKKIKNFVIVIAADCTGHGVPGAFMSMMGVSFLNEIIISTRLDNAGETLDKLRKKVKSSLHQTGKDFEQKDGMDISICMFEIKNRFLMYAGAYNPLYMLRNNELIQIKGDRQPIAIHLLETEFTNHTIYLEEDDRFYMFSDGYIDEVGGPDNKKFKSRRFKELILENHQKPMVEQKRILEKTLKEWQGDEEQVDDILVMGIKV